MVSPDAWRKALPILLLAFCQATLVVHDGQHLLPDISHCAVCGGHSVHTAAAASNDLLPLAPVILTQRLTSPAPADPTLPLLHDIRSRGPPLTAS